MAKHNELGKAGESATVAYPEKHDYLIRHRNWRKSHFELDVVVAKENELVIVEVETHSSTLFVQPKETVDPLKVKQTVRIADTYMKLLQTDIPVCFNTTTIIGENGNFGVDHMEEVFYPPLF